MTEVRESFEDVVEELEATRGARVWVQIYDFDTSLLVAHWEGRLESIRLEAEVHEIGFGGNGKAFLRLAENTCRDIEVHPGRRVFVKQGTQEIEITRI